ncbi:hypothetical protein J4212_01420 [Candidatus Woesearchaeota archaeon]|nr:hypothetical protein [Candidatus Woesearchaeota archaeon]
MKWLKAAVLLLFLISIPGALAELRVKLPEKNIYNIGEKITASVSIIEKNSYRGFLKVMISCTGYDLQYYTTPLELEANFRTEVQVPGLQAFESMAGRCRLRAIFENTAGGKVDASDSLEFDVSKSLKLETEGKISSQPNSAIAVEGAVWKADGAELQSGTMKIGLNGNEYEVPVQYGRFKQEIMLENLHAGERYIDLYAEDNYGNSASKTVLLEVLPVPTRVENRIEQNSVNPGEIVRMNVYLYDHDGNVMAGQLDVAIIGPDGSNVASKSIESGGPFNYQLDNSIVPGTYTVRSVYGSIAEESPFEVMTVQDLSAEIQGSTVILKDNGNVAVEESASFTLEGEGKQYSVAKKISLSPGEAYEIDFSREVPMGIYTVSSPLLNEPAVIEVGEDNRPSYRKIGGGIGAVTGAVISAGSYVVSRPLLASSIIIVIVLGIISYYGKGIIKEKIQHKKEEKEEDVQGLFKDFEFEK